MFDASPRGPEATAWSSWLSAIVAALAAGAAGAGLAAPGLYRNNALIVAAFRGNDLVTLALAVPLLAAALLFRARRPTQALLTRLGMLFYMLYNYVFYLYGAAFNVLFLGYAALVALSLVALVLGASATDAVAVATRLAPRAPARPVAAWMAFFAVLLGGLWVALSLGFVFTGDVPRAITQTDHPTGVVFAADLTLLVPGLVVGAVLLWRRLPWGYVLAPVMMLKASTYGGAMIAMTAFAGLGADPLLPLWAGLTLGCVVATWALLRGAP